GHPLGHRRSGPHRGEGGRGLRRRRRRPRGGGRVTLTLPGGGLRRPARHRARTRVVRRDPRRPRGRRPVRRHPAHLARRDRARGPGGRQGAAGREVVHRHEPRRCRGGGPGPVPWRLRHGGDVDPLPAGRRRRAGGDRVRGDRRGAVRAGRPRSGTHLRPRGPAVLPRARRRRAARPRRLRRLLRADAARLARDGDRRRLPLPDRRRRRGKRAARARRRALGRADHLVAGRAAGAGAGVRDEGLDRRAPALPPPADDRGAPQRRRAGDDHPPAARRRLRARARRGHRVPAGRADRERRHAAGRHPRRAG
ncbi:MAG: Putative oxidoreductase, partial [uncultured Nocardioidaceae bacterium]